MPSPTLADVQPLTTVDIPGVELCAPGEWNDREYTADEFRQAVATAHELGNAYHAPLKLGHADGQQFLNQPDGDPAMGWVENLRLVGDRLVGDFRAVPLRIAQLIKSGGYRGRSCEFWLNARYGGKLRPFMLKAVALLGIDAPAVEGLSDITALYNTRAAYLALDQSAQATVTLLASAATKTEGGKAFRKSDYAYTPTDTPSDWKLRMTSSPGGKPDAQTVGAAAAALGKGFRGNKVSIPQSARAGVKRKLRGAWKQANPDRSDDEMPDVLKNSRGLIARILRLADDGDGADGSTGDAGQSVGTDMAGASVDDIQSAVEDALAAQFPPAKSEGEDDSESSGADGPSQNVIDWFLHDSPPYVIVSDQDVDNLWKICFTYDPTSDTATLDTPIPVKGTYTTNDSGTETGQDAGDEGYGTDGTEGDGAPDGGATTEADGEYAMARSEIAGLAALCRAEPDLPALVTLAAELPDPQTVTLAGANGQQLVKSVIAAIDKALSQLGEGAGGRPGMGFIRTALAEVKKKLGGMKFPQAQSAPQKLTREGRDVELKTLARRLGLPADATEPQIEAKLSRLTGKRESTEMPATVATLSTTVQQLRAERDEERLSRALDAATKAGRLTPPVREEMVALSKTAGVDTAIRVVEKLPVVVDLSERGRDGDAPNRLAGQLSPAALELARKHWGAAFVESLSDQRSLAEKRDALQADLEKQRTEARLSRQRA